MKCPICESRATIWGHFNAVPVLQCVAVDCEFRFFDLTKWTPPYAEEDYYSSWRPEHIKFDAPWIQARVEIVKRFKDHGTVAEVGCGIGETAVALEKAGFQVTGVEESGKAIEFLKQKFSAVEWRQENALQFLATKPSSFDVITMFHVLEHIPEPKDVLKVVDGALRDGGVIVIEVPDAGGRRARYSGIKWDYVLDHHVNYFSKKSLQKLLAQYGYRLAFLQKTYQFSSPQGHRLKDVIKGALASLGMNNIIRTVWMK